MKISPASGQVKQGETVTFTATVTDAFGNPVPDPPPITWSTTGGSLVGSAWTAPGQPGTYTVTATAGRLSATASITVAPGPGEGGGSSGGTAVRNEIGCVLTQATGSGKATLTQTVDPQQVDVTRLGGDLVIDLRARTVTTGGSETLPVSVKAAEIPTSVLSRLSDAGKSVAINAGSAFLSVPPAAVLGPGGGSAGEQVSVRFTVQSVPPSQVSGGDLPPADAGTIQVALGTAQAQGFRAASDVTLLSSQTVVVRPDGTVTTQPLTTFAAPITVRIPFDPAAVTDPGRLGVYRLDPQTGQWVFRGGVVHPEGGYVEIQLSSFSVYAPTADASRAEAVVVLERLLRYLGRS